MAGQINKVYPHIGRSWKIRGVGNLPKNRLYILCYNINIKYNNITFYFV